MKIEPRYTVDPDTRQSYLRGVVLVCENADESALLDEVAGSTVVTPEGFIADVTGEVRLSDGYAEHYVYIPRNQ